MVIGHLDEATRYETLHPAFPRIFAELRRLVGEDLPLGRIEIDGDRAFINHVEATLVDQATQPLEAHRQYLDIHLVVEGGERFGWTPLAELGEPTRPYSAEDDYMLWHTPSASYVDLKPGQFVIVWPEDPHAPIIGSGRVRKLLAKVRV